MSIDTKIPEEIVVDRWVNSKLRDLKIVWTNIRWELYKSVV